MPPHEPDKSEPVGAGRREPAADATPAASSDVLLRLRAQSEALDRQAVELVARRAELAAQGDALARARQECESLRAQALRAKSEYERLTALTAQRESQGLKVLQDRAELIASREQELERRILLARNEVVARRAALEAERAEVERLREQLEQERAAIETSRRELEEVRIGWAGRVGEFEARNADLSKRETSLRAALDALSQEKAEAKRVLDGRQREQAALTAREAVCAERERELERRIQKARDELVRQRAEVASLRLAADAQVADLAEQARLREAERAALNVEAGVIGESRRSLEQRESRLESERRGLRQSESEVEVARRTLAEARQRLEGDRARLAEREEAIEARRRGLADEVRAIEGARAEHAAAGTEIARRLAALAEDEQRLAEGRRRAERTAETLAARHAELVAGANDVALERSRLGEERAELEARRTELEARHAQIEERDSESRQRALANEVEADQLVHERAVLEFAQEEIAGLREQREAEFESLRAALSAREARAELAERSAFAAPSLWVLRATAVAAVCAAVVGVLWLRFEPEIYQASARISITTQRPSPEVSVREHASALMSPELAPRWVKDVAVLDAWNRARDAGRFRASLVPEPPALDLIIEADTSDAAQRSVAEYGGRYVAYVNAVPRAALLPAIHRDLVQRRESVNAELDRISRRRTEQTTLLALCPPAERRAQVSDEVHRLRDTQVDVVEKLEQARVAQARLEAGAALRGTVTEADLSGALAADEMFRVDSTEHAAEARLYRVEVAASLVPLADRLEAWKAGLAALHDTLVEQRELAPPIAIAAVVEECSAVVRRQLAAAEEFRGRWAAIRERVPSLEVDADAGELLRAQVEAGEAAEAFVEQAAEAATAVSSQLANLRGGAAGGTRERVAASALQSAVERAVRDLAELRGAVASAVLSSNFQLDARDRRVRGLRARLEQRRTDVREDLQRRADAETALRREALLAETRGEIARLEREREVLAAKQIDALDALRSLEQAVFERRQLEADIQRHDRELAELAAQRDQLDAQLADAERGGPQPDRAALVSISETQVSGRHRLRNAGLVSGVAFAGMWVLCVLMVLKNPLRRRAGFAGVVSGSAARATG